MGNDQDKKTEFVQVRTGEEIKNILIKVAKLNRVGGISQLVRNICEDYLEKNSYVEFDSYHNIISKLPLEGQPKKKQKVKKSQR